MTAMQQMLLSYGGDVKLTSRSLTSGILESYIAARNTIVGPNAPGEYSNYVQGANLASTVGRDYLYLWQATGDGGSTSSDIIVNAGMDSTLAVQYNLEPQDTGDGYSFGGSYVFPGNGSGNTTLIEFGSEGSGVTVGLQSVCATVIRLENNDVFQYSAGTSNTTSATYQTKCSVTIPKTGFYLIIATAAVNTSAAGSNIPKVRIFDGTNAYNSITNGYQKDTTNYVPFNATTTVNLTQGATISLQYASDGTNTVNIRQANLVCLYIGTSTTNPDNMPKYYYAESVGASSTTVTTFQATASATHTIANPGNLHLLVGTAHVTINNNTYSVYAELINTSTSVDYNTVDWIIEPPTTTNAYSTLFCARLITFTQASNTISWRYRSENSAAAATMKDAHYALIDLGIPA